MEENTNKNSYYYFKKIIKMYAYFVAFVVTIVFLLFALYSIHYNITGEKCMRECQGEGKISNCNDFCF